MLPSRGLCIVQGAAVLGILTLASMAHAQDSPPLGRTAIAHDLDGYYGGERTSAYVVMALGVLTVTAGSVLVTRDGDFARGMGWPLLTLGALQGLGAVFYAFQVGAEIDHYHAALARDPAAFQREESAHLRGTTARFVYYRLTELALALGGTAIAVYGFASDRDVWKGVGLGVAAIGLPFLVIDTINNGRAARYTQHLRDFVPTLAVQPVDRGALVSLGGRF